MFEIRNAKNEVVNSTKKSFEAAKAKAQSYADLDKDYNKKNPQGPFSIFKIEQVWTTQTLEEALKS